MGPKQPLQLDPWIPCLNCNCPLAFVASVFEPYFAGQAIKCPECSKPVDWWDAVLGAIREHFVFGSALALAGAQTTIFQTTLKPNEVKELKLSEFGVPEDAEVLYLNLTSGGSAWPVVLHGNDVFRDRVRPHLQLLGRVLPDQPGDGPLSVYVTWFVRNEDDTTIRHLVEAARNYEAEWFDAVVVPANIAAEAAITPAVKLAFEGFASKPDVRRFLQDGATYAHQLKVLLPIVATLAGAPPLRDHIRGLLNRLRGLRNDIAHEGTCRTQSRQEAAEHLTAAVFAVQYASLLRAKVEAAKANGHLSPSKSS